MIWHFLDQFGYVLEDRRAIAQPVPWKGHQRWWSIPPELMSVLEKAAA